MKKRELKTVRVKAFFGQKLCDFGLWVLSLGPKDPEDRAAERELIEMWRHFKATMERR